MTSAAITQDQSAQSLRVEENNTAVWMSRKVSDSICNIANNLNRDAVPLVILVGMSFFNGADGGPLTYAACEAACWATFGVGVALTGGTAGVMGPPALMACLKACLPVFFAPSP